MDNSEKLAAYDTQDEDKKKPQYGLNWTPLYANKHKYVNKTLILLQTTGGKEGPNIDFMRKSQQTPQNGTQNGKRHTKLKG